MSDFAPEWILFVPQISLLISRTLLDSLIALRNNREGLIFSNDGRTDGRTDGQEFLRNDRVALLRARLRLGF